MKLQNFKIRGRQLTGTTEDGKEIEAYLDQRPTVETFNGFTDDVVQFTDYVAIQAKGKIALWHTSVGIPIVDECESITWIFRMEDAL